MEKLPIEKAMQQNQKMIDEWKAEALQQYEMAFFMAVLDQKSKLRVYRSEGMNNKQLADTLRAMADTLEAKPD
jgi:hypothetical protein